MHLPNIICVQPEDTALIQRLSDFGGQSFLEELWTRTLLDGMPTTDERKLELSRAIIACDIREAAPRTAVYCTTDATALAIGYLKSDLGNTPWEDIEAQASTYLAKHFLTAEENKAYKQRIAEMEPISQFNWHPDWVNAYMPGSDFIHFACLAVAPESRGTGAFRRLIDPFLTYADQHNIPCFLETYADKLEQLYGHFGFETIARHTSNRFEVYERCMVRLPVPHTAS